MPLHRFLELGLGGSAQVGQHNIQRVQLVKVPVPADGRARAAVAGALPVIQTLKRSRWKFFVGHPL